MTPERRAKALLSWIAGDPKERCKPEVLGEALRKALQKQRDEERAQAAEIARQKYSNAKWRWPYRQAGNEIAAAIEAADPESIRPPMKPHPVRWKSER